MNTEARLMFELSEAQIEIQRLRCLLATAPPTVHKDFSLVFLIPNWSGTESAISLEEFLPSIEGSARIGQWLATDCLQVAVFGLWTMSGRFTMGKMYCGEISKQLLVKGRRPHSSVTSARA